MCQYKVGGIVCKLGQKNRKLQKVPSQFEDFFTYLLVVLFLGCNMDNGMGKNNSSGDFVKKCVKAAKEKGHERL